MRPHAVSTWFRRGLAGALVSAAALVTTPARADTASEAKLQFELGAEYYKQARYAEALERFIASNRLVPNANVVLNIAQTFAFLGRSIEAYNWYETCLGFELDAEQRARVTSGQAELLPRVAVLAVTSSPSGAELFVDRVELGSVGTAPRRLAVEPGAHRVIARLPGHRETTVDVPETKLGVTSSLEVRLAPLLGELEVVSVPSGAFVRNEADGRELGRTPLRVELPVGSVRLVIGASGFGEAVHAVELSAGKLARVDARLNRVPGTFAILTVKGNVEGASVSLDGKPVGRAPMTFDAAPLGSHVLVVSAPKRQAFSTPVLLEPGTSTRVDFELANPDDRTWPGFRYIGYGTSAALLVAGGVVGALALGAHSDFEREPSSRALDRTRSLNTAADVLFASGALVGLTTLTWDLLRAPDPKSGGRVTMDR